MVNMFHSLVAFATVALITVAGSTQGDVFNEDVEIPKLVNETTELTRILMKFERIISQNQGGLDSRMKMRAEDAVLSIQSLITSWKLMKGCRSNVVGRIQAYMGGKNHVIMTVAEKIHEMNKMDKKTDPTELMDKYGRYAMSLVKYNNVDSDRIAKAILQGVEAAGRPFYSVPPYRFCKVVA